MYRKTRNAKYDVKSALDKLNSMKKRAKPEGIVADMLSALVDFGIDKITEVITLVLNNSSS